MVGWPVRMRAERGRGQLLIEQLVGIVLAALQLRDDDGPLGLAVGADRTGSCAIRSDSMNSMRSSASRVGGLRVRRLVDPRVAVPAAAELLDDAL